MCAPGVPLGESIGFGHKPGVAVVDFQLGFTDARFPLGGASLVERAVSNSTRLLAVARDSNVPIATCYTGYNSKRDMPYWKISALDDMVEGDPSTELDPRTYDPDYDVAMRKSWASMFSRLLPRLFSTKNQWIPSLSSGACVRRVLTASNGGFGSSFQRMVLAIKKMAPIMTICGMWGVDVVILQL